MQYRVVVCSCLDASILVGAQCTNRALMMLEEEVTNVLHPHREKKHVARPHWTHLLIDEVSFDLYLNLAALTSFFSLKKAAQGSEPELLIPISVVDAQLPDDDDSFIPQLALCGDIHQRECTLACFPPNLDFPDTSESRSYCCFGGCSDSRARGFITRKTFRTTFI